MLNNFDCKGRNCVLNAIVMFINSQTDSLITFQGYPYEFCTDIASPLNYRSLKLDVIFYETPFFYGSSRKTRTSPLLIRDTSFMFYHSSFSDDHNSDDILRVLQFSRSLSYQVVMENIAWCNNTINFFQVSSLIKWFHLLYAQSFEVDQSLHLKINNTLVQHNTIFGGVDEFQQLSSLMEFVNTDTTISGKSYFGQNSGGSIMSVKLSNLTITDNMTVSDGLAYKGGGIRLDSYSYLLLKEPLIARFSNNSARHGGGIYAPVHDNSVDMNSSRSTSAIQILPNQNYTLTNIRDINITLTFDRLRSSSSLYAPAFSFLGKQVSPFLLFDADTWDSNASLYAYTELIDTIFQGMEFDRYASLSNGVCVELNEHSMNCTYVDHLYHGPSKCGYGLQIVDMYPGKKSVSLLCTENKEYQIIYSNTLLFSVQHIPCRSSDYEFWNTSLIGNRLFLSFSFPVSVPPRKSYCISLSNLEVSSSIPFLNVHVLSQCPLGFNLTKDGICDCLGVLKNHSYECDINSLNFTSPPKYWTGYSNDSYSNVTISFNTNCPPNYCKKESSNFHLNDSVLDFSCLNNRTGILCGECKNQSMVFGSDACYSTCTNYSLLTLPVYALAGLLLVLILFLLRLTVATGTINGVIFYANLLELSMEVFSPENYDLSPLHIVISLINLNLGFPLCFYKGMTAAAKAGLQFIFPVYLWAIVIGLIIASRFSLRLSNLISRSSVQVLATLLYFSFCKVIRSVIYIINSSTVFNIEFNAVGKFQKYTNSTVWYYDGHVGFGSGAHGWLLFIAAAFTVLFIVPYTILLTFAYYLMRFKFINKFKPFLDAYGGPFKDKWRFWFGLRLWIMAILLSVNSALQGTNFDQMLTGHLVIIIVFILLQALIRPFRNQLVGAVDIFYMLNYWLIIEFYLQSQPPSTYNCVMIQDDSITEKSTACRICHLY